jgi:metallo-beta-lactamase family protein
LKIKIVGAAGGEVTGSAYFVQTERAKVLVHAGKFQVEKGQKRRIGFRQGSISQNSMQFC